MEKRVVVTGFGVLSSNAIGKEEFSQAIFNGVSGIKPISLFDTAFFKVKTAGEISNFAPQQFLGPKGLRVLDRSTKLAGSAAFLALQNASLEINQENSAQTAVVIGNTLGSVNSICDFDRSAIKDGIKYVNPALFPNTVISSASSQISIRFNIKGFNVTVANGFTSGLDAIIYAADQIKLGRAKIILSGGVEELSIYTYLGFYKANFMAGIKGEELSCPFDERRNGIVFGEGACVLVLEELESALKRKANILAEIKGYGLSFTPYRINKYRRGGLGLKKAMQAALEKSGLEPRDISFISAAANSTQDADKIEAQAIRQAFDAQADRVAVSALKSMLGECYSASGAFSAAAGICALEKQKLFPIMNYSLKDPECDLAFVKDEQRAAKVQNVLVNAFGIGGNNSSMVISKFLS